MTAVVVSVVLGAVAGCGKSGGAAEHLTRGRALAAEGKHEAATAEFTRAAELDKDSVDARVELGNAYRSLGQYDRAFDAYRAAKKIDRYQTRPHVENARALVAAGRLDAAIDQLNHVIELDAKNVAAMLMLGEVSLAPRPLPGGTTGVPRESLERAELNFESATRLAPDNADAWRGLATARERLGKKAEAAAAAEKLAGLKR